MSFCAYYYEFDETGVKEVDAVLSAVARAGKAYHHTDGWSELDADGRSEVDRIQDAARVAADEITRLRARIAQLEEPRP